MESNQVKALLLIGGMLVQDDRLKELFEFATEDVALVRASDLQCLKEGLKSEYFRIFLEAIIQGGALHARHSSKELFQIDATLTVFETLDKGDPEFWKLVVIPQFKKVQKRLQEEAAADLDKK